MPRGSDDGLARVPGLWGAWDDDDEEHGLLAHSGAPLFAQNAGGGRDKHTDDDDGALARELRAALETSAPARLPRGAAARGGRPRGAWGAAAAAAERWLVACSGGGGREDGGAAEHSERALGAARTALFASHALARWAWRMWEFAVALILIRLHPGSLRLISAYGLLDNLVRVVGGAPVGAYVDRTERLPGATSMYLFQNGCILASAAAAGVLLWLAGGGERDPRETVPPAVYWPLVAVTIGAGCTSSVGSMGAAAAVEREWVKVLCGGDAFALARTNSVMRAIDMLCLMLSPMAAGFLMTYAGMLPAVLVISGYAAVVWAPECLFLAAAHGLAPRLSEPKAPAVRKQPPGAVPARSIPFAALFSGWRVYLRQPTRLPALALALLYLTVLSLGFLMTAFLKFNGMSEAALSVFRGIAAGSGLLSTVIFPPLQRAAGLTAAGAVGFAWLDACLLAGALPVAVSAALGRPLSSLQGADGAAESGGAAKDAFGVASAPPLLLLLMFGLALSRLGIWLADLAVSQMQQELVDDSEIGTVNGVQSSVQSLFEILSFVAGSILHRPSQFHWLMLGSCAAVSAAGALYAVYALSHLLRGGGGGGGEGVGGGGGGGGGVGRGGGYARLEEAGAPPGDAQGGGGAA